MSARERLQFLAGELDPSIGKEIWRLYEVEDAHAQLRVEFAAVARSQRETSILAGHLRERLAAAERRLDDLPTDAIAAARRAAYMLGEGFVRVRHSRGRFSGEHVATDRVTVRGGE